MHLNLLDKTQEFVSQVFETGCKPVLLTFFTDCVFLYVCIFLCFCLSFFLSFFLAVSLFSVCFSFFLSSFRLGSGWEVVKWSKSFHCFFLFFFDALIENRLTDIQFKFKKLEFLGPIPRLDCFNQKEKIDIANIDRQLNL